jgi:hypothetical protein
MQINIGFSELIVSIVGGSRSISSSEALKLKSVIVDPDSKDSNLANVTYSWVCISPTTGLFCDLKDANG